MSNINREKILEVLEQIPWGTPLYQINKLYILMSLIRNKGNRTHTTKDVKMSRRTILNRIAEMRYDNLDYDELKNKKDVES